MAYTEKFVPFRTTVLRLIFGVCFLFCLQKPAESSPVNSKDVAAGIDYLSRFGYLVDDDPRTGKLRSQQDLEKSIRMLQRFAGITETGKLDAETIKLMGNSRCGVSDFGKTDNTKRKRRYTLQGTRWQKRDLTYKIKSFTSDIRNRDQQRQIFRKAFKLWSDQTNLRINENRYAEDKDVDIHISFETGYHSDAYPFDGQGGTLAHAFYPHNNLGLSGDAHFDDGEYFSTGDPNNGVNLDWVAVHEFGHSLGLEHSNVRESIMYPWYKGYKPDIKLTSDDVQGIQALYGRPTQPVINTEKPKPTTTQPPIPEGNDVCSMASYDAFFLAPDGKTYAVKGPLYWIISSGSGAGLESGPHKVQDLWKGAPDKIDAAYKRSANRLMFFSGSKAWLYYYKSQEDTYVFEYGKPRSFADYGLPMELQYMDAAFVWGKNSKTYLFKGDKYWRYDGYKQQIDYGYPRSIKIWKGLPSKIDAAMKWRNGKSYFFAGNTYYRFDDWAVQVEADYPKSIALKWMRCEKDNLGMITTPNALGVGNNATQGYGCDHTHADSAGSAVYPSLVTLCCLLLAILKLNF